MPWDDAHDAEWVDGVEGWSWEPLGGGDWGKSGRCPRCGHGIMIAKVVVVAETLEARRSPDEDLLALAERGAVFVQSVDGLQLFARCSCSDEHPGRPSGLTTGCGRWGYIDPPPDHE